jgi:membrane protease YdiL (CAAX protease family)
MARPVPTEGETIPARARVGLDGPVVRLVLLTLTLIAAMALIQAIPRLMVRAMPGTFAALGGFVFLSRFGTLVYSAVLLLAAFLAQRLIWKLPLSETGFARAPRLSDAAWGIASTAAVLLLSTIAIFLWKMYEFAVHPDFGAQRAHEVAWLSVITYDGWRSVAWAIGLTWLTSLPAEETFFRGFFQQRLAEVTKPWIGIVAATIAFLAVQEIPAIAEYGFDAPLGAMAVSLGLVHGWIRRRTGASYAPILSHGLTFLVVTLLL